MRSVGRLSIIALTVIIAAVALAAGERAIALNTPAAPTASSETAVRTRAPLPSPWPAPTQSATEPDQAARQKTFAWLLLLLKEQRAAR